MAALDLEWLEDFIEVAKQRNFSRAAEARGLTPSTLNRRIHSLEVSLGGTILLDRDAGLELTDAGTFFLEYARKLVVGLREAKLHVEQMAPLPVTAARIYTVHSLSATFVPRVVHEIRKLLSAEEYDTNISIIVGTISECTEALASSATPFMISYEDSRHRLLFSDEILTTLFPTDKSHVRKERILSVRIARDKLIPVCAPGRHDMYQQMHTRGVNIPFYAYSNGTYLSALVNDKVKALGLKLRRIGDAQMADTLRNLAREGDGIAWVLDSTARKAFDNDELMRFDFDFGAAADIHLDIKLFRLAEYRSPTIDQIWKVSKDLEASLENPASWLSKPC